MITFSSGSHFDFLVTDLSLLLDGLKLSLLLGLKSFHEAHLESHYIFQITLLVVITNDELEIMRGTSK